MLYKEKPTATNSEILDGLLAFCDFETNPDILTRIRKDAGLVKKAVRYCFTVSPVNQIRRKTYALQKLADGERFLKHIWSDECIVQLEGNKATAYVEKRDKYGNVQQVPKFPRKVLIWACMSWFGSPLPVVFEEGTVDTDHYILILEKGFLPFLEVRTFSLSINLTNEQSIRKKSVSFQKTFPRGDGIFVQDSAPAHTAGRTLDWLEERGIELEDHPPQSPDVNRIEVGTKD